MLIYPKVPYTHRNKLRNTFRSLEKFEKKVKFLFSGITGNFITSILYLGLAKLSSQHSVFVLLRIQYAMYEKLHFYYEFARLLLHSSNLNFGERNRHEMLNLIILDEYTTLDIKLHVSSRNHIILQYLQFALMSMESKMLEFVLIKN